MFRTIFTFEIKYRSQNMIAYLYFLFFFLLSFFAFAKGIVDVGDGIPVNSPFVITKFFITMSFLLIIMAATIMGGSIYREIDYATFQYFFSYPLTKSGYFWGRFAGSFFVVLCISSAVIWGAMSGVFLGVKLDWLQNRNVAPFSLISFFHPYFFYLFINLFFTSCVFFGLVSFTRNIKVIYSAIIIIYIAFLICSAITKNSNNPSISYYLDAFAFNPFSIHERTLTLKEKAFSHISSDMLLLNRCIWLTVGILILLYTYIRFEFKKFFIISLKNRNNTNFQNYHKEISIENTLLIFDNRYKVKVFGSLFKNEIFAVIKDHYFRLIFFAGFIFLTLVLYMGVGREYGVSDLPRAVIFIYIYNHSFLILAFLVLLFYTGEVIHRERSSGFAKINDSLPPKNFLFWSSKLCSMIFVSFIFASVLIVNGILVQLLKGYYQFNLLLYSLSAYLIILPVYIEMTLFSFAIHVLIKNKFAAHSLAIIIWILIFLVRTSGFIDYNLFLYSYTPDYTISDFDRIGPSLSGVLFFNLYWLLLGMCMIFFISIYFNRELTSSLAERNRLASMRITSNHKIYVILCMTLFLLVGGFNYYNVSIKNTYLTRTEKKERKALYEKQLKKYEDLPLPAITSINLKVDLFPEIRKAITYARLVIVNRTLQPLKELLIDGDELFEYTVSLNGVPMPFELPLIYKQAKFSIFKSAGDTSMYRVYHFVKPLLPGDSAFMELRTITYNPGFANGVSGFTLLKNGTFFSGGLPTLSYNAGKELEEESDRDKYGLAVGISSRYKDSVKLIRPIFSEISSTTRFSAVISTSASQTAIAPGELVKDWVVNDRHFFNYSFADRKTYLPFPILSASYIKASDSVIVADNKKILIEVYFLPGHSTNISRIVNACKDGLKYYTCAIGPYPFKQLRVIESTLFSFQKSFANTLTLGEHIGWNADFDNPNLFDYIYYKIITMLGSQWWKYKVVPNQLSSSNIISEGLPKFFALKILEAKYGPSGMRYILKDEMERYTWSHKLNSILEKPLINADKSFIWDNKAALVLYSISDLIGDKRMNSLLKKFSTQFGKTDSSAFPGAVNLLSAFKTNIPDSFKYFLTDSWEKITIYDNKMLSAKTKPGLGKNEYTVELRISVNKYYVDLNGKERAVPKMKDYIDFAIFGAPGQQKPGMPGQLNALYNKKIWLSQGKHTLNITVKGKPLFAGIDPYAKLIDKNPSDNIKGF